MLRKMTDNPKDTSQHILLSYVLAVLSGILLAVPFCNGSLWVMSWCGFVPLFFAWENKTRLQRFTISYVAGFTFFSCVLYWLIHVTLIGQIILVCYLSLYFGVFGMYANLKKKGFPESLLFLVPSIWVVLEFLRSILLTGFGWASMGYAQYKNIFMIQTADIGGVFIVSFLIVMANVALFVVLSRHRRREDRLLTGIIAYVFIVVACTYGWVRLGSPIESERSLTLSVVQGNIPQEAKWEARARSYILEQYLYLTQEAARDNPELIIWPESSIPEIVEEDSFIFDAIADMAREISIPMLVGAITVEGNALYNSALLISSQGRVIKKYDKLHLVPFGEYIPLKKLFAFVANIAPAPIGDFQFGSNYSVFSLGDTQEKFAVLICFEDVFPYLARGFAQRGAQVLVNITNDAWFRETTAPYQHMQASVFRAIENRRPVVRAANTGVSCAIDVYGRITSRVTDSSGKKDISVSGYQTDTVHLSNVRTTLYTRYGDIFVFCCGIFVIIGVLKKRI
ncbi:apolipoprotein N-acyltransferase [Candidatus Omnitrophota bacterium]